MEWLTLLTIEKISAAFFILATIVTLSKTFRAWIVKIWTMLFPTRAALNKHVLEAEATLNKILNELRPNGSTSVRDAIDRIEEGQRDLKAFLHAQLNIHSVAIVRTNIEGKVVYVNRYYQRILGVAAHEVMGDGWINVIHPEEREKVYHDWMLAVEAQREFNEDMRFISSSGEVYPGHVNVYKETDDKGRVRGYLGVIVFSSTSCPNPESCFELFLELQESQNENRKNRE